MAGQIETAVANRDNPPKVTPKQALTKMLDANASAVGASLPTGYKQERFVRLLLTAATTNRELLECDPGSFLAAGVGAAQLGLEPNDARGLAYLIPFNDKRRGKIVQLIIGYKGMLDLARRSGMVSSVHAFPVFRGDLFTYQLGLYPSLEHVPAEDGEEDPKDITHVYAVALVQDKPQFVVMSRRQIDKVMAGSPGARSGRSPWTTHYTEMALKTALRRLCKYLPQTVELARADEADGKDLHFTNLGDIGHSVDPSTDDYIEIDQAPDNVDADTGEIIDADDDPPT
jgi:recombination protein RecT